MNRLRSYSLSANTLGDVLGTNLDSLPDAELLDRFARYADHPAFETLVRRHGPTVLGVCRRTLGNAPDADDAFQATFLVFLRKCRSVRGERLGPWLYGVAWRVSQKARVRAAWVAARTAGDPDALADPRPATDAPDWLPVLDAELHALPRKYRDALILCELQGATRASAAKTLGLREGTLSSRLARGRDLLRRRLLKHGTLLPAGGLAVLFESAGVGRATVPAALLARTTGLPNGAIPVGPARLTDEVLNTMFLTKLRAIGAAALVLAAGTVGLAVGAWPADAPGPQPEPPAVVAAPDARPKAAAPQLEKKPRPPVGPDRDAVQGCWKLEKYVLEGEDENKVPEQLRKQCWLLIEGDVWWMVWGNGAVRNEVTLTPGRNPKWIDAPPVKVGSTTVLGLRGIYRLPDPDTIEFCIGLEDASPRPAEFAADADHKFAFMRYRRHALPDLTPAARADRTSLLGTWQRQGADLDPAERQPLTFTPHFAFIPGGSGSWHAYRYELDTGKDPAWIDFLPVAPDVPKGSIDAPPTIYGSFAVHPDGQRASLALGIGVKRIARPLEFTPDAKNKVEVWTLARPTEPKPPAPAPRGK